MIQLFEDINIRINECCNLNTFNANNFRYPEKISKVVAHAGQSYISETDMEKMMKVIDVSNWSARMREPMENIYGKVSNF